jgi:exodeoxyribonuclease X
MKTFRVIDFETTGLPPNCGIIEIGWTDVIQKDDGLLSVLTPPQAYLTNPNMPIDPGAMGVHHIRDHQLRGKPDPHSLLRQIHKGADYFVAHNAEFEQKLWPNAPLPWICTMVAARRLIPGAPNYKNQTLRYFLDLQMREEFTQPAHRAGPDSYVTAYLLTYLLGQVESVDDLIKANEPVLLETVPFGKKHLGQRWETVPLSYIRWCMENYNPTGDVRFTMEHYLKRGEENAMANIKAHAQGADIKLGGGGG